MSFGSKTTTQQQQQSTSSTALDPNIQAQATKNLNTANQVASDWNPTLQNAPVGFTQDQQTGFQATRDAATAGQPALNDAITAAGGAAKYQPLNVNATSYDAQTYNPAMMNGTPGYAASQAGPAVAANTTGYDAAQATGPQGYDAQTADQAQINRGQIRDINTPTGAGDVNNYVSQFSPAYQNDVIDASTNDLNRARIMANQGTDAAAAKAGAFGGSRQAIADSENNDSYIRAVAATSAQQRQQGFQTALQSYQDAQNRGLTAQQSNQGADVSTYGTNANLANTTNLQNASFKNQAGQYRADQSNQFTLNNTAAQNTARQFEAQQKNQASLEQARQQAQIDADNAASQNSAKQFNSTMAFNTGARNQDAANTAGQFNTTAANTAGQFNATQGQNAQVSNQGAGIAGAQVNLAGAQTLGNLGGQQFGQATTAANNLLTTGGIQQQQAQKEQDVDYGNRQATDNAGLTKLGIQQNALGLTPYGTTTTGSGSSSGTTTTTPGLGASLMSVAGMGLQGASLFMKSDGRLKENVKPMKNPLQAIHKMKGVNYDWKPGHAPGLGFPGAGGPNHDAGLIAQDVGKALPGAVKTIGGAKHYSAPAVLGLLTEAVKHLDKKVSAKR